MIKRHEEENTGSQIAVYALATALRRVHMEAELEKATIAKNLKQEILRSKLQHSESTLRVLTATLRCSSSITLQAMLTAWQHKSVTRGKAHVDQA